MTYQLIEDYTLDFTGGPMDPKGWAIHWWGDPDQRPTFNGILNVLITRSAQKSASVNFMAEAGKVACLVDPFTKAFAQGDGAYGWGNNNLVSLECNPRCTAEDRETVAELIADQNIRNGIPIVLYPHNKFTATQCPGTWEQYIPWITERAKQIVAEKTSGTFNEGNDDVGNVDSISEDVLNKIADCVLNRDIAWYGFNGTPTAERKTTTLALQTGWTDTQFHAMFNLVRDANEAIASVLDALNELPEIDSGVIEGLKSQLEAKLKEATDNLKVTLEVKAPE